MPIACARTCASPSSRAIAASVSLICFSSSTIDDSRKKYLEKYLEIYLNVAQVGDKSLPNVADCKAERDNIPIELSPVRNTLVLPVKCSAKNEKNAGSPASNGSIPIYTVDLQPWIQDSFK